MTARHKNKFLGWATAVLLLAAIMRMVAIQDIPPGLAQDEVLNADVVGFIREGTNALFFREGYGHEPLYHYWSVPFQILLGDNVLSIRLPAISLGLLLVALTMRWARREFGVATAVATGALIAISWWPIIFSRIGLRPIMAPLLLLAFAWFWPRRPWVAGLFLGLAVYSYTGARVVFLLPLLLMVYAFLHTVWQQRSLKVLSSLWPTIKPALIVLFVSIIISLPLAYTLWRDPSLQQRVQQLEGPLTALQQGDAQPILQTTAATLGVFSLHGDPRWTYSLPDRPLFDPVTAIFFYGGLLLCLWQLGKQRYAFVLIWLFVGLLPSAITPQAPSTVRMIVALPIIYLLPGLTIDWLWRRATAVADNPQTAWPRLLMILFLAFGGWNLWLTVRDGFKRWPQAVETRLKYQTVLLDMARYRLTEPDRPLVIADGFYRPITADSLRRDMNEDPQARWVQSGADVAGAIILPHEGNGRFYVPEYAPPTADLLAAAGVTEKPIYRSPQEPSFAVYALPGDLSTLEQSVDLSFGGQIRLRGYEIVAPQGERPLQLFTYWQVENPLPSDLAAFVHLLDEAGNIVAQHDGFDAAPATLQMGDVIVQHHFIPLPAEMPAGKYHLQLGLYTRSNGRRLWTRPLIAGQEKESYDLVPGYRFDGEVTWVEQLSLPENN